ncbi:hypothetical protein PoB_004054400 [Plakobranchus ocellatus]|uniref:NYN domain-containing protein n=1 Tax=Plakobranchus ocellatus TaxID=259542 RepID=A0AAV4B6P4_9GAST|nr:hypothetical protein PoB_004054400 [Plakobranchus ocellatus]
MRQYLGGEEPYSKEYMKKKLMKTLDSDIVITNFQGKDSVVTIRMTAEKILDQFWKQQKEINKTTVVIGEDTDLLVLLLHHADLRSRSLLLKSRSKTKKHRQIDILSMKTRLICHLLPFLHAINGCDTTSRLFGVAKGLPLKKIKTDADLKTAAETFYTKGKTTADIIASGERALIALYGG